MLGCVSVGFCRCFAGCCFVVLVFLRAGLCVGPRLGVGRPVGVTGEVISRRESVIRVQGLFHFVSM
jgi:hypothetical protein